MPQIWNIPVDSTDLLSDSRTDINDALDSLHTNFYGTADPSGLSLLTNSGGAANGMIAVNATSNKIKMMKGGAFINLGDFSAEMGHVRADGTVPMTGPLSLGNNRLISLAAPTLVSDGARLQDVQGRVAKVGDTMTGALAFDASYESYIVADNHAAPMKYVNNRVARTGDLGITGRLAYGTTPVAAGSLDILSRQEVRDLTSFNITTGHRHTGVDSRKVLGTLLDMSNTSDVALAAETILAADGAKGVTALSRSTTRLFFIDEPLLISSTLADHSSYLTVDVSAHVPVGTYAICIRCYLTYVVGGGPTTIRVRRFGSSIDNAQLSRSTAQQEFWVQLSSDYKFQWKRTIAESGGLLTFDGIYMFAYLGKLY